MVYGGLDLSEVADVTALVLVGWRNGKWHVHPTFWLPGEGLRERATTDHVPYDLWRKRGYLQTTPGKTVSYEFYQAGDPVPHGSRVASFF
jgi:phage terminase large subunit-like protein